MPSNSFLRFIGPLLIAAGSVWLLVQLTGPRLEGLFEATLAVLYLLFLLALAIKAPQNLRFLLSLALMAMFLILAVLTGMFWLYWGWWIVILPTIYVVAYWAMKDLYFQNNKTIMAIGLVVYPIGLFAIPVILVVIDPSSDMDTLGMYQYSFGVLPLLVVQMLIQHFWFNHRLITMDYEEAQERGFEPTPLRRSAVVAWTLGVISVPAAFIPTPIIGVVALFFGLLAVVIGIASRRATRACAPPFDKPTHDYATYAVVMGCIGFYIGFMFIIMQLSFSLG